LQLAIFTPYMYKDWKLLNNQAINM
jgi:hypothetical protein